MKPFDLEKALAGEPCYLKQYPKIKCYALKQFGEHIVFYSEDVDCWLHPVDELDEFLMWQEPRPRVQLDLPAPLKDELKPKTGFYFITRKFGIQWDVWDNKQSDLKRLSQGRCFATKQDAQEWLDAMKGARR